MDDGIEREIINNINHDNHHWPYNSSNFKLNPHCKTFYDKLKPLNLNFWLVYMCKACSTIMNGEMVRNLGFKLNLQGKKLILNALLSKSLIKRSWHVIR